MFEVFLESASDAEVAVILYSLEREADETYGMTKEYTAVIDHMTMAARVEYANRRLHYSMFEKPEE